MRSKTDTSRTLLRCTVVASIAMTMCMQTFAHGQDEKKDPSSTQQTPFAPGVVTVIPPNLDPEETVDGPLTLQEFLSAHPEIEWGGEQFPEKRPHFDPRTRTLVEMAKQAILRTEVGCLEFSFKPLRQIYIDLPGPDRRMQRKLVWYMVYRVRYRGGDLRPAVDRIGETPVFKRLESVAYKSRRFFPMLTLSNHITGNEYLDQLLPAAKRLIANREQITAPLYNSIEISKINIPYSKDDDAPGVWGIATWIDVNPKLDFVSVSVSGLSDAFQQDGEGDQAPYRRKALQLFFYRPGDEVLPTEDRIRFGVPAFEDEVEQKYVLDHYGLKERLDYQWIFRSVR